MSVDVRVKTRSQLQQIVRGFDEQCLNQFMGHLITRNQRASARSVLLSLREAIYNKINKFVIVQDEIAKSELPMEPIDTALQERVEALQDHAEQLQAQLEQARSSALNTFTESLQTYLEKSNQDSDETELSTIHHVPDCRIPSRQDIDRIKRVLNESDGIVCQISQGLSSSKSALADLTKVVSDLKGREKNSSAAAFEDILSENEMFSANAEFQKSGKRQKCEPPLAKRFQ
uniref:Uncharacterized protein n=1 Tax=Spongospora subterranea TaxID=70186 RepID=A0A0H5R9D6_9EUKA|eukprot:CRZ10391.1 hypothetical protein [Spongospora subterranea]